MLHPTQPASQQPAPKEWPRARVRPSTIAITDGVRNDAAVIARAMGRHLESFAWTHFVTLTSDGPMSKETMVRRFKEVFIRRIAAEAGKATPYFFALEGASVPGSAPHVHALIGGTALLSIVTVRRAWSFGITDARVFEPTRGAAAYIAKELLINPDDYDISRRMPPRVDVRRQSAGVFGKAPS